MTSGASSISRTVKEQLQAGRFVARVLAVFERACNLITPDGDVMALVTRNRRRAVQCRAGWQVGILCQN